MWLKNIGKIVYTIFILAISVPSLTVYTQDPQITSGGSVFQSAPEQGPVGVTRFTIFDQDDRSKISSTHQFPWSAVALLRIYWSKDDLVGNSCTGWMIGESALATAAHCIYDGGYPVKVVVKPGMNSDDSDQTPFGVCEVVSGIVLDAWIQTKNMNYDYGVYHLGCSIGKETGIFQFKATSEDWLNRPLQLAGYPKDKPGRTMWRSFGKVTTSGAKGFYYDLDTQPGISGSPVWDAGDANCRYCVVAIHSSQFKTPVKNFGVRIDAEVYQFLIRESTSHPGTDTVSYRN